MVAKLIPGGLQAAQVACWTRRLPSFNPRRNQVNRERSCTVTRPIVITNSEGRTTDEKMTFEFKNVPPQSIIIQQITVA